MKVRGRKMIVVTGRATTGIPQADTGTNTYDGMVVHDAEPDMGQIDADVEPDVMPAVIPGQCVDGEAFQAGTAVFVERTTNGSSTAQMPVVIGSHSQISMVTDTRISSSVEAVSVPMF